MIFSRNNSFYIVNNDLLLYIFNLIFGVFQVDDFNRDHSLALILDSFEHFAETSFADALQFRVEAFGVLTPTSPRRQWGGGGRGIDAVEGGDRKRGEERHLVRNERKKIKERKEGKKEMKREKRDEK